MYVCLCLFYTMNRNRYLNANHLTKCHQLHKSLHIILIVCAFNFKLHMLYIFQQNLTFKHVTTVKCYTVYCVSLL